VAIVVAGPGKVLSNPRGLDCGTDCTRDFVEGHTVSFNAFPDPGQTFSGWGGACSGEPTAFCTVTVDQAKTVSAGFGSSLPPVIPNVSIGDAGAKEGKKAAPGVITFAVTLSQPTSGDVEVAWSTVDGKAKAGKDYVAAAGVLTIPAGQTSGNIAVTLIGDRKRERSERFTVVLSDPVAANIVDGSGIGTIKNDDR
jgi:hypothetical protein